MMKTIKKQLVNLRDKSFLEALYKAVNQGEMLVYIEVLLFIPPAFFESAEPQADDEDNGSDEGDEDDNYYDDD